MIIALIDLKVVNVYHFSPSSERICEGGEAMVDEMGRGWWSASLEG